MAISTIAEKKAKYKGMLINWFVSVAILFTLHFFMVGVVTLNETILGIIKTTTGGWDIITDIIFADIIKLAASKAVPATIVYIVLTIYLIKFILLYLKRLLKIIILTLMAPVIAIGYSIDKIKDNKSQSLSAWMKQYIFNVFVQLVHALTFVVFMGIIRTIIGNYELLHPAIITRMIIMLVLLNFMLKSEKIVKKIFGMNKKGTSVGEVAGESLKGAINSIAGFSVMKDIASFYAKHTIKPVASLVAKPAKKLAKMAGTSILKNTKAYKELYKSASEANDPQLKNKIDKMVEKDLKGKVDFAKQVASSGVRNNKKNCPWSGSNSVYGGRTKSWSINAICKC